MQSEFGGPSRLGLWLFGALLLTLATGCSGTDDRDEAEEVGGDTAIERDADWSSDWSSKIDLRSAFRVSEYERRSDKPRYLDGESQAATVDYRSRVVLDFDRARLREIANHFGEGTVLPDDPPGEAKKRQETQKMLEKVRAIFEEMQSIDAEIGKLREGHAVDRTALESRLKQNKKEQTLIAQAVAVAIVHKAERLGFDTTKRDTGEWASTETERFSERLEDLLVTNGWFNPDPLAELLNEEFELMQRLLADDLAAAKSAGAIKLRVRGTLQRRNKKEGEAASRLRVENYDEIDTEVGEDNRAVSFDLSPEELAELQARFAVVQDFADLANDVRDRNSAIRKSLRSTKAAIKSELEQLPSRVEAWWKSLSTSLRSGDALTQLKQEISDLPDSILSATEKEKLTTAIDEVEKTRKSIVETQKDFESKIRPILQLFSAESVDIPALLEAYQSSTELIDKVTKDLPAEAETLVTQVKTIFTRVNEVQTSLAAAGADSAQLAARIDGLAKQLVPQSIEALEEAVASFKSDYPGVATTLSQFVRNLRLQGQAREFAGSIEFADADQYTIDRAIDDVVPAEILLGRSAAEHDDKLFFRIELIKDDQKKLGTDVELDVVLCGAFSSWETPLIFVDRMDEPAGSTANTNYEAAPSASWTLHYRKRAVGPGSDWWAPYWNFIDPGLGINVAALNFEDSSVEPGVGVHSTFFDNLLHVGVGWNLGVSRNREYFFVGVGLFETLNVAGLGLQRLVGARAAE